jgi:hypothetical protein
VQSPPLLERGKSEHPPEKAQLTVSDRIRRPQGDAEAVERDQMTSRPLSREDCHRLYSDQGRLSVPAIGRRRR